MGTLIEGEPPVYVGIYVDDIIYMSLSDEVERIFESMLSSIGSVEFMGKVSLFLGIEFNWIHHDDGNLTVHLTQQSFAENLVESFGFDSLGLSSYLTPYRSGCSIDSVPDESMSAHDCDALRLWYQSVVGSLNWLAHTTRPDLSTVVSLLAQHQSNPSPGHMDAAVYAVEYLAHTQKLGIYFTSYRNSKLSSFLHFPLSSSHLLSMSDVNWGPQDGTQSKRPCELPLFVSRLMLAFYIDLYGPLHWMSKRQSVTAGSSAEAEIYATNECVKFLLELSQLFEFLHIKDIFIPGSTTVYNDNCVCVLWSKCSTTKGLHHIQMHENMVRENIVSNFVTICHVNGKLNLADIFTKEMKDCPFCRAS
jgi:hypothetical protein